MCACVTINIVVDLSQQDKSDIIIAKRTVNISVFLFLIFYEHTLLTNVFEQFI